MAPPTALASAITSPALMRLLDSFKRDKVLYGDFERQLDVLEDNITKIKEYRDAVVLGDKIVATWYMRLEDLMYAAVDMLDVYAIVVEKDGVDSSSWRDEWRNILNNVSIHLIDGDNALQLAQTIQMINEKIDQLLAEGKKHGYQDSIESKIKELPQRCPTPTSIPSDDYPILGRDTTIYDVTWRIRSDQQGKSSVNLQVLPIVGMGGIGKTTLAQYVYASEKHRFDCSGWIHCSSENIDVKALLTRILSQFGKGVSSQTLALEELATSLVDVVRDRKFLLVIDDVWCKEKKSWEELLAPLKRGKLGSKLVITTRGMEVVKSVETCHRQGVEEAIKLERLSDDNLWRIVKDHTFGADEQNVPDNLEVIGKRIAKKLKGLPLAAKAIGRVLGANISERDWKEIENSELWNLLTLQKDINLVPALTLSYLYLPSKYKPCFTYLSLFPKDNWEVDTTDLVSQWLAHGYLDVKDRASEEDAGAAAIKYLQSMSLLTVREIPLLFSRQYMKMHDLIHDTSQLSGRDDHLQILDSGSGTLEENLHKERLRHFSYICTGSNFCMRLLPSLESCKKLRTLIFIHSSPDSPSDKLHVSCLVTLLKQLECLRVLTLRNLGIEEVPEEIGELNHLRYLDLSKNPFKYLPGALVKLCRLQVLKLNGCTELLWHSASSNVEVLGQLARLQYLNLSDNHRMTILPECITLLSNLQDLSMYQCYRLKQLPEDVSGLKCLERLELSYSSIRNLPESLVTLSCLRELHLDDCQSFTEFPSNFINLKNLRVLSCDFGSNCSNIHGIGKLTLLGSLTSFIVKDKEGHKLDELANLNMLGGKFRIENLVMVKSTTEAQQARLERKIRLRELMLCWKEQRKSWKSEPDSPSPPDKANRDIRSEEDILEYLKPCERLEKLSIQDCMASKLPSWLTGKHFRCLKHLSLFGLHIRVLGADSSNDTFPCLKVIEICSCPELKTMPNIPSLEELLLENLPKLSQFTTSNKSDKWFPCLRKITISNCPELKTMPDMPLSLEYMELKETGVSKLPSLQPPASAAQVSALAFVSISGCSLLESLKQGFLGSPQKLPNLGELVIKRCPSLSKLSTLANWLPSHLWKLVIEECRLLEMESLHAESLTSLKTVKLFHFCRHMSPSFLKTVVAPRLKMHESLDIVFDDTELEIKNQNEDGEVRLHIKNRFLPDNEREKAMEEMLRSIIPPSPIRKLHVKELRRRQPSLIENMLGSIIPSSWGRELPAINLTHADLGQLLLNLPSLKRLKIEGCNNITSLPSQMSSLSSLEAIKIESCEHFSLQIDSVKHLALSKCGSKWLQNSPSDSYHKIETLELRDCHGIQYLWCLDLPIHCLRKLVISDCINLEDPPLKGFTEFVRLETLVLLNCPKLSRLSTEDDYELPSSLSRFIIQDCAVSNIQDYLRHTSSLEFLMISIKNGRVSDLFVQRMLNDRLLACVIDSPEFGFSYGSHICEDLVANGYYDEFEEEKRDQEYYSYDKFGNKKVSIRCTYQELFMEILEWIPSDAITSLHVSGVRGLRFDEGMKKLLLKFRGLEKLTFANCRNLKCLPIEDMRMLPCFDTLHIESCPQLKLDPLGIPTYWTCEVDNDVYCPRSRSFKTNVETPKKNTARPDPPKSPPVPPPPPPPPHWDPPRRPTYTRPTHWDPPYIPPPRPHTHTPPFHHPHHPPHRDLWRPPSLSTTAPHRTPSSRPY